MKRKVVALLCTAALAAGLVGCGGNTAENNSKDTSSTNTTNTTKEDSTTSNDTSAEDTTTADTTSDEKITLRMAWWGSQTRHDRTVAAIELYESLNPNIDIEYEFYDFDGYFNKLNTLVASNDVWDIIQMGSNYTTYQSKIVNLDQYIEDGTIDVSDIPSQFLDITRDIDGNLVGISNGLNSYGVAYNPELFTQAGLSEPATNWTWEEWYNDCITISEKLGIYGSSKLDDWICGVSTAIPQAGAGAIYNETLDGLGFTDYTVLEDYLTKRTDLVNAGAYPDPGALAEISDIENDFLSTGEAAMTWVATNQFETLEAAAGVPLKLALPPRKDANGPVGLVTQSSQMLCASADSDYPAEAAKFIAWFETSVDCNNILLGERGIPVANAVREALSSGLSEAMQEVYAYIDTVGALNEGKAVNSVPAESAEIQEQYTYLMDKVIYGQMSASDAAKEFYDFAVSKFN